MTEPTPLTPAEAETLQLANRGLSQRTIALALNVSRSTVRSRLENARRKLAQAEKGKPVTLPSKDISARFAKAFPEQPEEQIDASGFNDDDPLTSELGQELSRRLWINPRKDDAA